MQNDKSQNKYYTGTNNNNFNNKSGMKKSKIANASTSHKLTRNLKEEFEQFTIRDQNS